MYTVIKSNKFFLLSLLIIAVIFSFQNYKKISFSSDIVVISNPTEKMHQYISNYKGQAIDLFKLKRTPLSSKTINTFKLAYKDLNNLRLNPGMKQKIDQETYYHASNELKELKKVLIRLADCKSSKANPKKVCEETKMVSNARLILTKIATEISENKKIPYRNEKEYFYAVCETIFN